MENNIIGGNRNEMIVVLSNYSETQNEANRIMQEGILDRYLIGRNIIPFDFNYNENVSVHGNFMLVDLNQNRFIYNNINLNDTFYNAVRNNLHNNKHLSNLCVHIHSNKNTPVVCYNFNNKGTS